VVVAIFLAYMLFKAAKALERVDKVLADVDENGIPLMRKVGNTLDGVNSNLGNVDEITKDVAGITDKLDKMAGSMETAVTTPARKAAAFSAGVQSAVSNFMKRDKAADAASGTAASWSDADASADPPEAAAEARDVPHTAHAAGETTPDAGEAVSDAPAPADSGVADVVAATGEAVADATADAKSDGA
jgi:uncharacterized protein YoxC